MSFTDHKITQFQHRIADLPDEPQIPAAELKSRFDACPEELRQSLNAVCDDAARLEARVEGIVVDTFGDTIDRDMLSDELEADLSALEQTMPQKCEVYVGNYKGDGTNNRELTVPQDTKAVIIHRYSSAETYIALNGNVNGYARLDNGTLSVGDDSVNTRNANYAYICLI